MAQHPSTAHAIRGVVGFSQCFFLYWLANAVVVTNRANAWEFRPVHELDPELAERRAGRSNDP